MGPPHLEPRHNAGYCGVCVGVVWGGVVLCGGWQRVVCWGKWGGCGGVEDGGGGGGSAEFLFFFNVFYVADICFDSSRSLIIFVVYLLLMYLR